MANFLPLKHHMFYCLDRFVERYGLHGPFLEVGCGRGDVSAVQKGTLGRRVARRAVGKDRCTAFRSD